MYFYRTNVNAFTLIDEILLKLFPTNFYQLTGFNCPLFMVNKNPTSQLYYSKVEHSILEHVPLLLKSYISRINKRRVLSAEKKNYAMEIKLKEDTKSTYEVHSNTSPPSTLSPLRYRTIPPKSLS